MRKEECTVVCIYCGKSVWLLPGCNCPEKTKKKHIWSKSYIRRAPRKHVKSIKVKKK